jgi:TonB family protein
VKRASLVACAGLAACMSFWQAARPPAPHTEFTFGIGGSVTVSRFVGGRTRIAIIGTEGPSIDVYVDSSALATLTDRAEARDSAKIFEQSARGGSVWLGRIGDAYDVQAIQSAQTIGVHFTALQSPTLLAMLRGLPRVYPDPPLGIDRMPMALPDNPGVRYPKSLRGSQKEGTVILNVLIDTTGLADPSSIRVVQSNDTAFTAAVIEAIRHMHFLPAMARGRKVRETVSLSYVFAWPR